MLGETPQAVIKTQFGEFKPWGGHRLWVAPEANPRSYWPDNVPVHVSVASENEINLRAPIESGTGIQKAMTISLDPDGSRVEIIHEVTNHNLWEIELSPWALTIMHGGGTAIIPQEPYRSWDEFLLPARPLVLWHYTNLTDARLRLGERLVQINSEPDAATPLKLGVLNKQGWAAYYLHNQLFVKRFDYLEGTVFPDYNSNNEVYTQADFIELETLGALQRLQPGGTVRHIERWDLYRQAIDLSHERVAFDAIEQLISAES
jgi:hypothetical protein